MGEWFGKIRIKYALAFIGVALAVLLVAVVDALLVNTVRERMLAFSGVFNPAVSAVLNGDRDLYQARLSEVEYLAEAPGSPRLMALAGLYEEDAVQAYERMQVFISLLSDYPEVVRRLNRFEALYREWRSASGKVLTYWNAGEAEAARAQLQGPSLSAFEALRGMYNVAGEAADAKVAELEKATVTRIRRQGQAVALFVAVVFVLAAALALMGPRMMSRAIEQVSGRIREITEGDGDLTARIDSRRRDEIGELAQQFNRFISRIDVTLQSVRDSARSVHRAADEIAQSSQELSSRTEQTAANLQETSASMEEITATVGNSSDAAQQADELAKSAVNVAHEGHGAMREVERTMQRINESAARINDIVSLIDGIAFQTNILALNASVEAARAGEHGRGFAVVAQEVRSLASRCGEASRDIRSLVEESVGNTRQGADGVRKAGDTMTDVVAGIEQVTRMIGEISSGAQEQSRGIGQVNTAVAELDSMTQHNAAMVEQASAAADEMRVQADQLQALIGSFRLSADGERGQAREAERAPMVARRLA